MKRYRNILSLLLLIGLIYYSFYSLMPQADLSSEIAADQFSIERALIPLKEISKKPHYHGSQEHKRVRLFLEKQLQALGFETQIQEGFLFDSNSKRLDRPKNIVAKLRGAQNTKALILLSHYDSALIPSFGASDAGSGVVTILESIRAYLASGASQKNDIIIVFSDAEEIGLDGAHLFVSEHPWAKEAGLVLNFEARGSGGPSNMILETNGGNANLVKAFVEAKPEYPVASSLMYSIYKMLPNDTDSTVFREIGDIDSYFFAFIDDHFDYHTANDTFENLDRNTLAHQGSYLLPLIHYFAENDLSDLKSNEDYVYVNFPFIKMISYPFSWVVPMLILASFLLIALIFFGISKRKLSPRNIGVGFLPFLVALIISGVAGFFGWKAILYFYPQYQEIQHGFTYNGHTYIAFFVFLILGILFRTYHVFSKKIDGTNLLIAPLVFWMIINGIVAVYLKGAGYFIIPVFFALLTLWVNIKQEQPNKLLMLILAIPAIFLFAPLIQFFPVGLGLKMIVLSSVFTVLLFGLLLSVTRFYKMKKTLSYLSFILAALFFISAHTTSDFSEERQKPNSLIYYQDANTQKAFWLTYDKTLDDWTKGYLGDTPEKADKFAINTENSKYNTGYSFASEAPNKSIPLFETLLNDDTIIDAIRKVRFTIIPNRNINQISLFADTSITFQSLAFNGKIVPKDISGTVFSNRKENKLLRYYVADNDSLEVSYTIKKEIPVSFTVLEYSFDLLDNNQFTINKRPKHTMPKPFVITDAIVIKNTIDINTLIKYDSVKPLKIE
jgi:hypothetical protein